MPKNHATKQNVSYVRFHPKRPWWFRERAAGTNGILCPTILGGDALEGALDPGLKTCKEFPACVEAIWWSKKRWGAEVEVRGSWRVSETSRNGWVARAPELPKPEDVSFGLNPELACVRWCKCCGVGGGPMLVCIRCGWVAALDERGGPSCLLILGPGFVLDNVVGGTGVCLRCASRRPS